jgi:D-3-phosphoglycerate dehydrogenase / 2-oxoglutarate reductase
VSVAELTLGLMLSMARHIPRADQSTRAGKWEKKDLQGTELAGKTLGIVGLGRIGTEVAKRAQAFGMKVDGCDPYISPARAHELGITLCTLDELYASSDYISLHVGLTHQTSKMINREAIAKMKDGIRIVNCARGELIDDDALGEAIKSGKVATAALDVFTEEPPKGNALLQLPNDQGRAGGDGNPNRETDSRLPRAGNRAERCKSAFAERPGVRATASVYHAGVEAGWICGTTFRVESFNDRDRV